VHCWVDEVYSAAHKVVVSSPEEFAQYACRELGATDLEAKDLGTGLTICHNLNGAMTLVYWFSDRLLPLTDFSLGIIVHEVTHGCQQVMRIRHVPMAIETFEPWAYYVDTVFSHVLDLVRKEVKRRGGK
jgi:hypothetical protein